MRGKSFIEKFVIFHSLVFVLNVERNEKRKKIILNSSCKTKSKATGTQTHSYSVGNVSMKNCVIRCNCVCVESHCCIQFNSILALSLFRDFILMPTGQRAAMDQRHKRMLFAHMDSQESFPHCNWVIVDVERDF